VTTSDGSLWNVGYFGASSVQYWRKGDRVVVNKSDRSYADYVMINVQQDVTNAEWVSRLFAKE
tara:strand:- start:5569 stop:5757 length:189 start_codon:yes stop_codon:yes gene_type:complete